MGDFRSLLPGQLRARIRRRASAALLLLFSSLVGEGALAAFVQDGNEAGKGQGKVLSLPKPTQPSGAVRCKDVVTFKGETPKIPAKNDVYEKKIVLENDGDNTVFIFSCSKCQRQTWSSGLFPFARSDRVSDTVRPVINERASARSENRNRQYCHEWHFGFKEG